MCSKRSVGVLSLSSYCTCMDDILLIENDVPMLISVKLWLFKKFFMKDLGEASFILKIKVYRDKSKRMLELS